MGLTIDAREGPGLRDAAGRPIGAAAQRGDPYFAEVSNELADRGFLVTSADDLIQWART